MEEDFKLKHKGWYCGYKFVKWGISFFILGLFLGFGVLIHYLRGSHWNNSDFFLSNITLWFGSPLTLSAGYLQIGGLGMAIIGGAKLWACKFCYCETKYSTSNTTTTTTTTDYDVDYKKHGHGSLIWCIVGMIALFITGYIGYFVIDAIWPAFYYQPIQAGKNLWLILQGLSLVCYFIGILTAFCCICKCKHYKKNEYNHKV